MKVKKSKWLVIMMVMAMLLALVPAVVGFADEHDPVPNYAYVPNALEASVSKVDLAADTPTEVARYSTIEPRPGDYALDKYRVSRLAIDSGGNAWALNTMTGSSFADYAAAQGSVARISATPVGADITSTSGDIAGIVTNDDRVSYHDLGAPGDGPRTITIVEEGGEVYLWIGFYLGNYFQKYWYNEVSGALEVVVGAYIDVGTYTPYTTVLDGDGIMWVVSRNASPFPSPAGVAGVFCFNTNNLAAGVTALPYDLPGKSGENPYAMVLGSDGRVWVSDGSNWFTGQTRYFAVYTYDPITKDVTVDYISSGSSQAMRGFMEDPDGNIWATTINGLVLKGSYDVATPTNSGWTFTTVFSGWGELAGIGMDYKGNIWVIRHTGNDMRGFKPGDAGYIAVGLGAGPYAYDNFIVPAEPPTYGFCGYKYVDGVPTAGWEILLEVAVSDGWAKFEKEGLVNPATTGPDGKYCFDGLPAGTYRVSEVQQAGYKQVYPVPNEYIVVLPGGETQEGTILYGTQRNNPGNNGLYEIDLDTGTSTRLFNAGGSGNSPNGLGFDPVNKRLYYMYVNENAPFSSNLYFYDLQAGTETVAGLSLPGQVVVGASFFEGAYYYIPNLTADLHKVSLNPDGTLASDTVLWANFNGGNPAVYRFGDFAINRLGMLYASTNDTGGSTAEVFKLNVLTGEYTLIADNTTPDAALLLQVSFGSDGTLYGHAAGTGEFFTINLETGVKTFLKYVSSDLRGRELFSDLASGFQPYDFYNEEEPDDYDICGFKYLYGTDKTIEGWKIYLHADELDEGADPAEGYLFMTTTDDEGKYCFGELPAGTYFIYEEQRDGYKPHVEFYEVTLPGETDLDADDPTYWNFSNEKEKCETAWGWNEDANENWDLNGVNNWGWNFGSLSEDAVVEFELWAGAGQNDRTKGDLVGTGTIDYSNDTVIVTVTMGDGFSLDEFHLWVGETNLPITRTDRNGNDVYTSAPGQFSKYMDGYTVVYDEDTATFTVTGVTGNIYVAVHTVVCWFPSDIIIAE